MTSLGYATTPSTDALSRSSLHHTRDIAGGHRPRRPLAEAVSDDLYIDWAHTPSGRYREIVSRSGNRRRYIVPCFRNGFREAHGESLEEAQACTLLDACPGVEFQEQPARVRFTIDGQWTEHFPDLLVRLPDGTDELWECKRDTEVFSFDLQRRTRRLQQLLKAANLTYRLVQSSQLLQGSYLENARRLRRRNNIVIATPFKDEIALRLKELSQTTLGAVVSAKSFASRSDSLLALIYWGAIRADLSALLSAATPVWSPGRLIGESPWVLRLFANAN